MATVDSSLAESETALAAEDSSWKQMNPYPLELWSELRETLRLLIGPNFSNLVYKS